MDFTVWRDLMLVHQLKDSRPYVEQGTALLAL